MSDDLRKTVFGSRDTQFQGFAKLLQQEIWNTELSIVPMMTGGYPTSQVAKELTDAVQTLIAQRAYDLVYHALYYNDTGYWPDLVQKNPDHYKRQITKATNEVPDLTQWPDSPDSE